MILFGNPNSPNSIGREQNEREIFFAIIDLECRQPLVNENCAQNVFLVSKSNYLTRCNSWRETE